ncbi:MAG TPA: hypothetical protein VN764_03345 [Polyangiaceae bacterium]|nr:hypothetical protein [Polyangiaceae bacterium]
MKRLFFITLCCALAVGCNKKSESQPEKSDKTAEKAKDEKPKAAKKVRIRGLAPDTPRSRGDEIPTSEDFEEEASRTVALENLEAELDRLEAEIVAQNP